MCKTTSTFNISVALVTMGKQVLMTDFHPQASLTISSGLEPLELKHNICDILKKSSESVTNCIYKFNNIPNLSIMPSIIDWLH